MLRFRLKQMHFFDGNTKFTPIVHSVDRTLVTLFYVVKSIGAVSGFCVLSTFAVGWHALRSPFTICTSFILIVATHTHCYQLTSSREYWCNAVHTNFYAFVVRWVSNTLPRYFVSTPLSCMWFHPFTVVVQGSFFLTSPSLFISSSQQCLFWHSKMFRAWEPPSSLLSSFIRPNNLFAFHIHCLHVVEFESHELFIVEQWLAGWVECLIK